MNAPYLNLNIPPAVFRGSVMSSLTEISTPTARKVTLFHLITVERERATVRDFSPCKSTINMILILLVTHFQVCAIFLDVLGESKRGESVLNNSGRLERQLEGMQNERTGSASQREARTGGRGWRWSRTTIVKMKEMDESERGKKNKEQIKGQQSDISMACWPAEHFDNCFLFFSRRHLLGQWEYKSC